MLGAPLIIGSLSSSSVAVQFQGLVPGATVRLQRFNGTHIAQWTASHADQAFSFAPGVTLTAGDDVRAVQFTATEPGLLSAMAVVYGPPTAYELSQGTFAQPLYECGECVWLAGLFAGATATVTNFGQEVLGSGIVRPDGQIEVHLNRAMKAFDRLGATQTCAGVTSSTIIDGGDAVPLQGLTLPQTQVAAVPHCATALYFAKGMNGASFLVNRTPPGGTTTKDGPYCLPSFPFTLWGFAPFKAGEVLVIEADLTKCKKKVGTNVTLTVGSGPPNAPAILNTICADTGEIILGGLIVNALVEIAVNTFGNPVLLHFGASAPKASFSFSIGESGAPVVLAGTHISVRQNVCGGPNDWSAAATTIVLAAAPTVPHPVSPANHAVNTILTPLLDWQDTGAAPCSQAASYNVRVGTTSAMTTLVFAPTLAISGASITIPAGVLMPGDTYFWQVRAYHPGNTTPSAWSAVFQFTTNKSTPPPPPNQTYYFCETCPDDPDSVTITVEAPDYATAEKEAKSKSSPKCMLQPGKCPRQPPPNQTFYFCQTCPGFDGGQTITIEAPDLTTAENMANMNLPSGCFLQNGKCS